MNQCRRCTVAAVAAAVATVSTGWSASALAQAPPEGSPPTAVVKPLEPLPTFRMEATKADRLPYTNWKTHLGPAADAVVTASVTTINRKTRETTTRTGVGVVTRCDGFVLLPASLFPPSLFSRPGVPSVDRRQAGDRIEEIVLHTLPTVQKGGSSYSGTVATPVPASFPATLTRYTSQSASYVLVKVQNVHLPAAALLHPRNVASAGAVEVVFPQKQSDTAPLTLQRLKARVVSEGNGAFSLTLEGGDAAAASSIPPGAVVVDTTAKMVLGIVAPPLFPAGDAPASPSGASLPFHSFERFHDITNAVGLVPSPDERLQTTTVAARKPGLVQEGMVWVPGGPLTVQADAHPELEGASVACTPGFWIAQNEVTLGQYKAFMGATGYRPQSGVGLVDAKEGEGGTPGVHDDALPVHGVSVVDAEAYAAWKGNRLATPLEWQWASRGGDLLAVQPVPATVPPEGPLGDLALMRMDIKAFKLNQFDASVVRPGTAWTETYARAHAEVERNTRIAMLVIGYHEALYWSFLRSGLDNRRNSPNAPSTQFDIYVTPSFPPEYQNIIQQVTPSGTVRDSTYAETLYRNGALQRDFLHAVLTPLATRSTVTFSLSVLNALMRPDLLQVAIRLMTDMFEHVAIVPAGSHAYDRSMFDVRHTQTNVHEWLQPNRASSADPRAVKPLPPLFDAGMQPNWENLFLDESMRRLTAFNVAINNGNIFNPAAVGSRLVFSGRRLRSDAASSALVPSPFELFDVEAGRLNWDATTRNVSRFPTPLLPFVRIGHPEDAPDLGTGFRCAR